MNLTFREQVSKFDLAGVKTIITSSGFFNQEEAAVAVELVQERLMKGEESGYYFVFAEANNKTLGYACFGPIPGTRESFDLYWIAVHAACRGTGIGKKLLRATETKIAAMGGHRIYVETSSREQYEPTRAFYEKASYRLEAVLHDFYAPGDSKCIYLKVLSGSTGE